ncbi:MAG: hypothetical protein A3G32_03865 [Deltaproteobacteria bacterium RIFCSPLOWO2_12_FULL_40_28]|nr:MAG: hypothetical protein A3C45_05755 [Deltaproteobacteria bacterium RIFCSPHIGHO2_02_FULL_40_28]OGQ19456.1 MAG: hypothetical protein A3E27_06385 [Deltaproteobacteria bacterium RIFCSPHIGHO2_12_FULL_40_32]OGQ39900.1 MAG: hypothetical protein A3I69_07350 [Deltaproteobacteria bacterium RIFCSPLOWO2_02_FULL_40_36]OGQ53893.1 MAG: hypothetical protein A3G32_03865 [Deltaproteobacteria bacterium RIFCSPLOWO2_12_FULL_40_28]
MKEKDKKSKEPEIANEILGKIGKVVPGFEGFFKKMEGSKTFGFRMKEIRKEINRRFGGTKK